MRAPSPLPRGGVAPRGPRGGVHWEGGEEDAPLGRCVQQCASTTAMRRRVWSSPSPSAASTAVRNSERVDSAWT
eukprot:5966039-Lingulodinium_polyedra.AAC.1